MGAVGQGRCVVTEPAPYRTFAHFIGIDPGPVPGLVMLTRRGHRFEVHVVQCSADVAPSMLWGLLDQCRYVQGSAPAIVQIERFVVGRRAARSRSAHAGATTRDLVGRLEREAEGQKNVRVVLRSAAEVKPWATDSRLKAVQVNGSNLLDQVSAVGRHARDAARHALFCAVKDGGVPDPLSTRKD